MDNPIVQVVLLDGDLQLWISDDRISLSEHFPHIDSMQDITATCVGRYVVIWDSVRNCIAVVTTVNGDVQSVEFKEWPWAVSGILRLRGSPQGTWMLVQTRSAAGKYPLYVVDIASGRQLSPSKIDDDARGAIAWSSETTFFIWRYGRRVSNAFGFNNGIVRKEWAEEGSDVVAMAEFGGDQVLFDGNQFVIGDHHYGKVDETSSWGTAYALPASHSLLLIDGRLIRLIDSSMNVVLEHVFSERIVPGCRAIQERYNRFSVFSQSGSWLIEFDTKNGVARLYDDNKLDGHDEK